MIEIVPVIPQSTTDIPSSVTFLGAICGILLIAGGLAAMFSIRYQEQHSNTAVIRPIMVMLILFGALSTVALSTFQTVIHIGLALLIIIISITSVVPILIVWRLSTISTDRVGIHSVDNGE